MRFRLLPAGSYRVGLSMAELRAARKIAEPNITVEELTPVIDVTISSVLVSEIPVTNAVAREYGIGMGPGGEERPAMLTRSEADTIAQQLSCRMLSEAEWETCCRAGTSSLFPWGWHLRSRSVLDGWLSWDIVKSRRRNRWGFGGLFFGEWCEDEFRISHEPGAPVESGAFVVKGGGAQFWPWQDQEWVWCMPAMRMPSSALFSDGRCALRLALDPTA